MNQANQQDLAREESLQLTRHSHSHFLNRTSGLQLTSYFVHLVFCIVMLQSMVQQWEGGWKYLLKIPFVAS